MASVAAPSPPSGPAVQPPGMEEEAARLAHFATIPAIARAVLVADGGQVSATVLFSQRDLAGNSQRRFARTASLSVDQVKGVGGGEGPLRLPAGPPIEMKDVVMYSPSPSGRRLLVVRNNAGGGSGPSKPLLELWDGGRLSLELSVPPEVHGPVYNDGWFGLGAVWDAGEQRVAYVAEGPKKVQTPEWRAYTQHNSQLDGDSEASNSGGNSGGNTSNGASTAARAAPRTFKGLGPWAEDWGELNVGKAPPTLFVVHVEEGRLEAVQGLPAGTSCGQPAWTPDGSGLVFVSWPHRGYAGLVQRLGMVYCFNRPAALWAVGLGSSGGPAVCLTPHISQCCCPTFTPCGRYLLFLSKAAAADSGVHNGTSALYRAEWQGIPDSSASFEPQVLVPVVDKAAGDEFPGLNTYTLPLKPFIDGDHMLLVSQWRTNNAILCINVSSGQVSRVTPLSRDDSSPFGGSWNLLGISGGLVLADSSRPNSPPALFAAVATPPDGAPWRWTPVQLGGPLALPTAVAEVVQDMGYTVLKVTPDVPPLDIPVEVLLIHPGRGPPTPGPALLMPHGGPHGAFVDGWTMSCAFLVACGYTLLLVNFRGSTGYGEAAVQALPGRIGELDVADCCAALKAGVEAGWVDPARVGVMGGSHGGFLTGHLVGQHPELMAAAVLRNPVLDLSLMVNVTDIPDWCYVEAWGSEEGLRRASQTPTAEDFVRLRAVSPMSHIHRVQAPLMFMLGAKDERVPMEDSQRYVWALQSRADAPPVEVLMFPQDTHGLDKPQTEFEQILNMAWWFKRHLS